jgi:hypothetical protein
LFELFKGKANNNYSRSDIERWGFPLEDQLRQLKAVGISLKEGFTGEDIGYKIDIESVGSNLDYLSLLNVVGEEFLSLEDVWGAYSDDVWYLDTQCIEEHGVYVQILQHLARISKGTFNPDYLKDYVDIEIGRAWVSFKYGGKEYRFDLEVKDDWFDESLICKLNKILLESNSLKQYAVAMNDQSILVGFFTPEQCMAIKDLTGVEFKIKL